MQNKGVARRSALIGAAAAGVGLVGYAALKPKTAKAPLKVGVSAIQNPENTAHWIALEKGFFKSEGLDTTYVVGGLNAPPQLTLLSAKVIDIAKTDWASLVQALAKGQDLVIIAAGYPRNPACLISLPPKPLIAARDIVGKKLLLQFVSYRRTIDAILAVNHLPATYTVSPTGFNANALFAGDGDAYYAYLVNGPVNLELSGKRQGTDFIVTPLSRMGYKAPDALYVVRRETLQSRRAALVSYLRAILRAKHLDRADPAYGVDLVVKKYAVDAGVNPRNQLRAAQIYHGLDTQDGAPGPMWFSPAQTAFMYQVAAVMGHETLPAASRLIDLDPLLRARSL